MGKTKKESRLVVFNASAPIDREDELKLFKLWKDNADVDAAERIVRSHIKYAVTLIRSMIPQGIKGGTLAQEDLYANAVASIWDAMQSFEIDSGYKFISYLKYFIISAYHEYVAEMTRPYKTTRSRIRTANILRKEVDAFFEENGRLPSIDELSERVSCSSNITREVIEKDFENVYKFHFVERNIMDDYELIIQPQQLRKIELEEWEYILKRLMNNLDDMWADIVKRYFGVFGFKKETLQSIGDDYGYTRARIAQLKDNALVSLKEILISSGFSYENGGLYKDE